MRPQYHLRKSAQGLQAWDVRKLVDLAQGLPVCEVPLVKIQELDESFWFEVGGDIPTCRRVAEHARLMAEADLRYPIILDPQGRVMDGMHRVCKALSLGLEVISAYQLLELPEPEFVGLSPDELPYEEGEF